MTHTRRSAGRTSPSSLAGHSLRAMRVAGFELRRYSLPLTAPLKLAGVTLHHREGLLLRLVTANGTEGWGDAAPLPGFSHESLEEAESDLRVLAETMTDREIDARRFTDDQLEAAPSARFGFETALWNLYAAEREVSLAEVLCSRPGPVVPLNGLLSGTTDEVLADARRMRRAGYRTVKLKVGGRSVEEDVESVNAARAELGEAVELRLDANRAWSFEEAASFARGVAGAGIAYIEEPLADASRLPELVQEYGVPIALDETLVGMDLEDLEQHRYASTIVLKPTLLGGVSRVLRLAQKATKLGMTPVVSSAYESGVGMAALISVAAAISPEPAPAGFDTYRRLADDTVYPRLDLTEPTVNLQDVSKLRIQSERWPPLL